MILQITFLLLLMLFYGMRGELILTKVPTTAKVVFHNLLKTARL